MNRTGKRLRILWLDHDGKLTSYGEVAAGKRSEQSTLVGHVWVLTDLAGVEVAWFVAGTKAGRAIIE